MPRNFEIFWVDTTLPITFAINMPAHLSGLFDRVRIVNYLGNTLARLLLGRAITCTLCTSPAARAALAPASTAARTEPTSPVTKTEHRPLPILFQPTNSTLA